MNKSRECAELQGAAVMECLYRIIQQRKANPEGQDTSYTVSLFQRGLDTILKKTGEEAIEVVIAGKGGEREEVIYETADLLYHVLVLLGYYDIEPEEIFAELRRRFGISGITEKESR